MRNIKSIRFNKFIPGFTLIEIVVIIAIIGILATITFVGYGNWRSTTTIAQIKSDLNGASAAMENARTFDNAYPHSVPSTFISNSGSSMTGGSVDGKSFCIVATNSNIRYYIINGGISTPGTCPPVNLAVIARTADSISLSWSSVSGVISNYGYRLQRSNSPDFASPTNIDTNATTAISSSLPAGTYYYRINATVPDGTSGWSNTLIASTYVIITIASSQTWAVPAGVTSINLAIHGGQGGTASDLGCGASPGVGGYGGKVIGDITVTPGQELVISIGGVGANGAYRSLCSLGSDGGTGGTSTITTNSSPVMTATGGGGGTREYRVFQYDDEGYTIGSISYSGSTGGAGSGTSYITGGVVTDGGATLGGAGRAVLAY